VIEKTGFPAQSKLSRIAIKIAIVNGAPRACRFRAPQIITIKKHQTFFHQGLPGSAGAAFRSFPPRWAKKAAAFAAETFVAQGQLSKTSPRSIATNVTQRDALWLPLGKPAKYFQSIPRQWRSRATYPNLNRHPNQRWHNLQKPCGRNAPPWLPRAMCRAAGATAGSHFAKTPETAQRLSQSVGRNPSKHPLSFRPGHKMQASTGLRASVRKGHQAAGGKPAQSPASAHGVGGRDGHARRHRAFFNRCTILAVNRRTSQTRLLTASMYGWRLNNTNHLQARGMMAGIKTKAGSAWSMTLASLSADIQQTTLETSPRAFH